MDPPPKIESCRKIDPLDRQLARLNKLPSEINFILNRKKLRQVDDLAQELIRESIDNNFPSEINPSPDALLGLIAIVDSYFVGSEREHLISKLFERKCNFLREMGSRELAIALTFFEAEIIQPINPIHLEAFFTAELRDGSNNNVALSLSNFITLQEYFKSLIAYDHRFIKFFYDTAEELYSLQNLQGTLLVISVLDNFTDFLSENLKQQEIKWIEKISPICKGDEKYPFTEKPILPVYSKIFMNIEESGKTNKDVGRITYVVWESKLNSEKYKDELRPDAALVYFFKNMPWQDDNELKIKVNNHFSDITFALNKLNKCDLPGALDRAKCRKPIQDWEFIDFIAFVVNKKGNRNSLRRAFYAGFYDGPTIARLLEKGATSEPLILSILLGLEPALTIEICKNPSSYGEDNHSVDGSSGSGDKNYPSPSSSKNVRIDPHYANAKGGSPVKSKRDKRTLSQTLKLSSQEKFDPSPRRKQTIEPALKIEEANCGNSNPVYIPAPRLAPDSGVPNKDLDWETMDGIEIKTMISTKKAREEKIEKEKPSKERRKSQSKILLKISSDP